MPGKLIDGAALAQQTKQEVSDRVAALKEKGRSVHLTAVLVGSTPAGELYAERQRQACEAVGVDYELRTLPADSHERSVSGLLNSLNRSMGLPDAYPFVLTETAVAKLRFVHEAVRSAR